MSELIEKTSEAVTDDIKNFLSSYKKDDQFKYVDSIDEMVAQNRRFMIIDLDDFDLANEDQSIIINRIITKPTWIIPLMEKAVYDILHNYNPAYAISIKDKITIRFKNCPGITTIRKIKEFDNTDLCVFKGIVMATSDIMQSPAKIIYKCSNGHRTISEFTRSPEESINYKLPTKCSNQKCVERHLEEDMQESIYMPVQFADVLETPDEVLDNKPQTIHVTLVKDLTDVVKEGDRIVVTGIKKLVPIIRNANNLRKTIIIANNVEKMTGSVVGDVSALSEREIEEIRSIAQNDDPIGIMKKKFAKHIIGQDIIKECMLYLMVGGVEKYLSDGRKTRGSINIFLVGDPGVAKSDMGRTVAKLSPKGVYASGPGASKAGLTAAVEKDPVTQIPWIKLGLLPLGDLGVAVIDEFEKLSDDDRRGLHTPMEDQFVVIQKSAKGTLNARTALLAIANPKYTIYDDFKNFNENIDFEATILQRFDLIFVYKDVPDKEKDRSIAKAIFERSNQSVSPQDESDARLITNYAAVARTHIPKWRKDPEGILTEHYLNLRNNAQIKEEFIPIATRHLQSMMRIAEAAAKWGLREFVEIEHVKRAIEVYNIFLEGVAKDAITGKLDIGILSGQPVTDSKKVSRIIDVFKVLENKLGIDIDQRVFADQLIQEGICTDKEDAKKWIRKLLNDGTFVNYKPDCIRRRMHSS